MPVTPVVTDYSQPSDAADETDLPAPRLFVARDGGGERLDQYLAARLTGISRTRVQRWIALGAVRVEGLLRLPSHRLGGHERIEVEPQPLESEQAFQPDPVPLTVLHRDEDVVVIDKPPGLVTHPAPGHWRNTLMNGLLHADPKCARLPRAGIVHRLDRDTSGLLVCARSERAFTALTAQLAERSMSRQYFAIVEGPIAPHGAIDAPIGRDPRNRLRMAVVAATAGKPARTRFRVIARSGDGSRAALVLRLETGRTHQIRVHLASIGHPLIGDITYGGRPREGFGRQALHAWRLAFVHPSTGSSFAIDCPLPDDLRTLAAALDLAVPTVAPADPE